MKKPRWYHVEKFFRGGSHVTYIESTEEEIKIEAVDWAENSDGGSNYGYQVYWKKSRKPPKEWREQKLKKLRNSIEYAKASIKETQDLIKWYEKEWKIK